MINEFFKVAKTQSQRGDLEALHCQVSKDTAKLWLAEQHITGMKTKLWSVEWGAESWNKAMDLLTNRLRQRCQEHTTEKG